jgi:hypothetical protein
MVSGVTKHGWMGNVVVAVNDCYGTTSLRENCGNSKRI